MAITVAPQDIPRASHILIRNATWRMYRSFVEEIGDGNLRVTYSNGMMEIMSPLPQHERRKKLIGRLIEMLTLELNIPSASLGSTTYADRHLDKGLEPDECYYIANEAAIRGKDRLDLAIDPPPDLAVEVDISYRALDRESIYASLGVPELWRDDGESLRCLVLQHDRTYQEAEFSKSFPFLRVKELERFLAMVPSVNETAMLRAFREWIGSTSWGE